MPETPAGSHTRNRSRSGYAAPAHNTYAQQRSGTHGHAASGSSASSRSAHRASTATGSRHDGASSRSASAPRNPEQPQRKKSRYIPALDGLRALAVLGVIAYHMGMAWMPGGLLGVTVFFVLSGYLITSLLLIEWDSTGTINLPQFWLRRVKRLFPAIAFVIICTAVLCTLFDHSLLTKLREDMWAALCWVTNWWYILRDVSYFDALGAPSPVTHFWSLAIEEQFYVVWPVVLILAHKFGVKRSHMRNATFVLALASALEMALLFNPDADPSRVYYGTDTRAFSLLIGAWLAFVWPSNQLGANNEDPSGPQRAAGARRRGRHRAHRLGGHDGGHRGNIGVHVSRRYLARLRDHHGHHRRHRAPVKPVGEGLRRKAARMDRPTLLRHVPVALPHPSAYEPAQQHRRHPVVDVPGGACRHLRHLMVLL